jgi:uncharacterized protein (DUF488 family)
MIYSIGYQWLPIEKLIEILNSHNITHLVDVRSKPTSRNASYRYPAIKTRLEREGILYTWGGKILGGLAPIEEKNIKKLAEWQKDKTICIMCMEAVPHPHGCHRHFEIAVRLKAYGVQVLHIIPQGGGQISLVEA